MITLDLRSNVGRRRKDKAVQMQLGLLQAHALDRQDRYVAQQRARRAACLVTDLIERQRRRG